MMKHIKLFEQFISEKEEYTVAGRPVTLNKGEKSNGLDWTVTFLTNSSIGRKGQEIPLVDVLSLIKPFPKGITAKESVVNEYDTRNFKPDNPSSKDIKGAEKWLKKYMSRTAKTTNEATKRIKSFAGGAMFTHVQYHEVMPNGNMPNRPTFRLHQSQEWLNDTQLMWMNRKGESVNATLLTIYDITDGADTKIGQIYVDTRAFLDELNITFEVIKRL